MHGELYKIHEIIITAKYRGVLSYIWKIRRFWCWRVLQGKKINRIKFNIYGKWLSKTKTQTFRSLRLFLKINQLKVLLIGLKTFALKFALKLFDKYVVTSDSTHIIQAHTKQQQFFSVERYSNYINETSKVHTIYL